MQLIMTVQCDLTTAFVFLKPQDNTVNPTTVKEPVVETMSQQVTTLHLPQDNTVTLYTAFALTLYTAFSTENST